ncbi:MAG TPA: DUF2079 domain-containing protein [Lentimicrobium sp.]|nr:DUF2079 domain-containing protein [Lentimicrobium sp.]
MVKKLFWISFTSVFLIFALIYAVASIYPHINFRTAALDLGMFNHALYSFAHFRADVFTLALNGSEAPYFGDHFSPITVLYAPFYYLFGEYTLLIIQIIVILAGGYGIFKYAMLRGLNQWVSLLITVHFFTLWGIYSALGFDFHNNVIAAMFVPWFMYFFEKGELKWMLIFYLLIIICKENMALWMIFILLALVIRKEGLPFGITKKYIAGLVVFAAIYFVLVSQVIMPELAKGSGLNHLGRFTHLGDSLGDIALKFWRKPDKFFYMLFENTISVNEGTGVKSQLHFLVLISGGFAFFRKPHFLIMLAPIYAQKMFSNSPTLWGISGQYSIEFVPVISLAVISFILYYKEIKWSWTVVLLLLYTSVHFNEKNLRFLKKEFYVKDINVEQVNDAINRIPGNAVISVNSALAPHLAFRDKIYHFPVIKDAEYIAIIKKRSIYPMKREDYNELTNKLKTDTNSRILEDNEDILIAKITPAFSQK